MTDDDLTVTCRDGCTEITKKGGYHSNDLADASALGQAASVLCRRRGIILAPWASAATRVLAVTLIALLALSNWIIADHNRSASVLALLRRAHGRYMRVEYSMARSDVRSALLIAPSNVHALRCLHAIDAADSSDRE